ncbi:hypothetical protein ABEB36_003774 [Hypothenemus hampei]|uniref:Uncharacterized protein n=1 Tax=Hypothenemus hampei TaxID=57062 RepID=A0ABD1F3R2_HYPHA
MSKKTENNSGDVQSEFSTQENSPRSPKVLDFDITEPCENESDFFIYHIDNSFAKYDLETSKLKIEYLYRLKLLRDKLASIDIIDKSYYNNCFDSSRDQCIIAEITDDDRVYNDKNERNHEDRQSHLEINDGIAINLNNDIELNREQELKAPINRNIGKFLLAKTNGANECTQLSFMLKNNLKEEDTIDIIDLNYNPPKKKSCLRDNTPRLAIFEGAMPLPYHIRVSLHEEILKADKRALEINNNVDEKNQKYVFSKEQIIKDERDLLKLNSSKNMCNSKKSIQPDRDQNLCLLFLDTMERSSTESPLSDRTAITETTLTLESPYRNPKKSRLFLRSARNKPMDKFTLWEEIRTMEAINRRNRPSTSSSKDSFFQNILFDRLEREPEVMPVCSLEVPRAKNKRAPRFPSITKIARICPFKLGGRSNRKKSLEIQTECKSKEEIPQMANAILNLQREQNVFLCCEEDDYTPTNEKVSEYEFVESADDIDENYQPFCLFCFCF